MTIEEFRLELASYRNSADAEAKFSKDSQVTLERLHSLYREFDDTERQMACQVFAEWALSEDEGIRFDALALVADFKITVALPALKNWPHASQEARRRARPMS